MSLLMDIATGVGQVADAIAIALDVEVEIVDDELTLVGGTGVFRDRVGEKEEAGCLDGNFLYARLLRDGDTAFVEDTAKYRNYGVSLVSEESRELAEVCTPIRVDEKVVGIIALIAIHERQRARLVEKAEAMVAFVEKMADLLAAKAEQKRLLSAAKNALACHISAGALKYTFDDIIGESEALRRTKEKARMTARGHSTVLITGESGTGKEMFAKAIHYSSARSNGPFVTVNCGAIPENLLESELFGYEKGAFTGASDKGRTGRFEMAEGGTIFLDEIGDMPPHLQVKILHVLQNMRFERVGGSKTVVADARIIAATNRDLETMIRAGAFREDLYYRLSVIPLTTPPLRERREDIEALTRHFLKKYNAFMNKDITGLTAAARRVYESYDWPGNVRELENAVEYGVNMAFENVIGTDAIPERLLRASGAEAAGGGDALSLSEQVRFYEKEVILRKLQQYGNAGKAKDRVARELGLSRATLYRKLAEMDIS